MDDVTTHFSSLNKYLTMCEVSSLYEFGKIVSVSGQGMLRRRRRRRSVKKNKKKKNNNKGCSGPLPRTPNKRCSGLLARTPNKGL